MLERMGRNVTHVVLGVAKQARRGEAEMGMGMGMADDRMLRRGAGLID
jgi:hypothetical protein